MERDWMKRNLVVAFALMGAGIALRFSANAISWPKQSYSYSGPREATEWAIREAAINDLGMGCFYLGGILLVGVLLIAYFRNSEKQSQNQ